MNALQFLKTGSVENLRFVQLPKPILSPGEGLVRVRAAGINFSDAGGIKGIIPITTVPRVPGRDFSGEIVEVNGDSTHDKWLGAEVWGTGGLRGFKSDGTFTEYMKVPLDELSRKPKKLSHTIAASITLPWLCAWIAIDKLAQVKQGDNVLVIGASGAIGSNVAQLCHDRGANVLGTYRSLKGVTIPPWLTPIELLPDEAHSIRDNLAKLNLHNQVDVLVDCAGYDTRLNDALYSMTPNGTGRVVVMAVQSPDGLFPVDFRTFYMKGLTLKGLNSNALGPLEIKSVLDFVAEKIDSGVFIAGEAQEIDMKDEAGVRDALTKLLARAGAKRSVIVP